jgi:hypothetical protein
MQGLKILDVAQYPVDNTVFLEESRSYTFTSVSNYEEGPATSDQEIMAYATSI